jgi:hypothetical protein
VDTETEGTNKNRIDRMETGSDFVHIICKKEECFESESDNSVTDRQESAKQ